MELLKFFFKDEVPAVGLSKFKDKKTFLMMAEKCCNKLENGTMKRAKTLGAAAIIAAMTITPAAAYAESAEEDYMIDEEKYSGGAGA